MANIQHSALTGSDLHEPKGITGAASGTSYVSNGAGTGVWTQPEPKGITGASSGKVYVSTGAGSGAWSFQTEALTTIIQDISTAGSAFIVVPYAGTVTRVYSVIEGAISGANSTLTPYANGIAMTSGGITVAFTGSAAGDVDSSTPTGNNTLTTGQVIRIDTDGASTNAVRCFITVLFQRTA